MELADVMAEADRRGRAAGLVMLERALSEVEAAGTRDQSRWVRLSARRADWLIALGRGAEAVLVAGRLVEVMVNATPAWEPTELSEAMSLLAEAFAADGDPVSGAAVTHTMLRRFPADDPLTRALHLRASALRAGLRREAGQSEAAAMALEALVDRLGHAADTEWGPERILVHAELALTHLAQGRPAAAVAAARGLSNVDAALPESIRRAALRACRELAVVSSDAGQVADSVHLQSLAVDLLAPDRSLEGRRERAAACVSVAQGLALLGRCRELRGIAEICFATYSEDPDTTVRESAVVAGCLGAQASLALGHPEAAGRAARRLVPSVPDRTAHRLELLGRIGLILASVELETRGPESAERAYRELARVLADGNEPGARLFLAFALDLHCAVLGQLDRLDEAGATGRELGQLIATFPSDHDFPAVAECGNRSAIRLITRGRAGDAVALTRAVIERKDELLGGPDEPACVRAFVLLADAVRLDNDLPALYAVWREIMELGEPALVILDALAEHYGRKADLRAVLAYVYVARASVLRDLDRPADAQVTLERFFDEFADDPDEQIQAILAELRPENPDDPRLTGE